MTGSLWDAVADLGEPVTLHRYAGYASTGGHHAAVFHDAEEIHVSMRPWQSDVGQQADEGRTGQTPGKKMYANPNEGLKRGDRIIYAGGHFRLTNPHHDQTFDIERWDARTDEREFRLLSNIDLTEDDLEEPDTDGFRGY